MRWIEIRIEATDTSSDAAAQVLADEGCGGTASSRPPGCVQSDAVDVVGYLPVGDRIEDTLSRIRDRVRAMPGAELVVSPSGELRRVEQVMSESPRS